MWPEQEESLVSDLSKIRFNPLEIETQYFGDFYNDSLVLRLSRPDALLQLNKKIVDVVQNYADSESDEIIRRYFGDNYDPHLTISRSSLSFDRASKKLIGQKDLISRYHLAKKLGEVWKEIQDFHST